MGDEYLHNCINNLQVTIYLQQQQQQEEEEEVSYVALEENLNPSLYKLS